ncbi:hypothetical protein B0J12DRAFT_310758 [Macrophomina phaseolina]|uniref:Fungal N-terminal domain-containing protein n=1 Tax=Macrophomina phaseolina TaxID=35725 RepID=A0ABQ8FWR2_9PEZI|nr:hypothetical protein B0J12DRAFT_310758 [Macrophomina phaseolina]
MDGLSGAASVAGIVSLSVQLTESIHKICKFFSAFKHASEDIEDIIDDLEVLSDVVADIQRYEELFGPHHAIAKAILRCRRQAHALERMTTEWKIEMEKDSKWRRGQAAFKSVLKVEKVKEIRVKIGEAKGTLSLALQASYSRTHHTQLFAIVQGNGRLAGQTPQMGTSAAGVQSLVHKDPENDSCLSQTATSSALRSPAVRPLPRRIISRETASWHSHGSWIQSIFGSLSYKHISQTVEDQFSEEDEVAVALVFEPAWWLQALGLNSLLRAQIERTSRNGWKTSLRPQQLMSEELFETVDEVIWRGDLDSLRTMLCSGEVTIRSVNIIGGTLLHAAAYYSQAEICDFLLEAGVDRDEEDVSKQHSRWFCMT